MRTSAWRSLGCIALAGALAAGLAFPAGPVAFGDTPGTQDPPPEHN